MLAGELQVMVANVQLLKPRKVCYSDSTENGARDFLTTRCSQSTGLIELGEHSFESNARLFGVGDPAGVHASIAFIFRNSFFSECA